MLSTPLETFRNRCLTASTKNMGASCNGGGSTMSPLRRQDLCEGDLTSRAFGKKFHTFTVLSPRKCNHRTPQCRRPTLLQLTSDELCCGDQCRCRRRSSVGRVQIQVAYDPVHFHGIDHEGDDSHAPAATGAAQCVDIPHAL